LSEKEEGEHEEENKRDNVGVAFRGYPTSRGRDPRF